jgi:hypothetical protein
LLALIFNQYLKSREMIKRITYCLYVISLFFIISCGSNDEPVEEVACNGMTISYSTDVSPLISTNCATTSSCHGVGSSNGPGPLTSYTPVFNNRNAISAAVKSGRMPKDHTLSSDQKNKIVCWIENGAANN